MNTPCLRWLVAVVVVAMVVAAVPATAGAAELRVGAGESYATIGAAMAAANDGDVVVVTAGTYSESVETQRAGISLRAAAGAAVLVTASGRVLSIDHARTTVEGIIFDGEYGTRDAVVIASAANDVVLRGVEVRHSGRDCIDIQSPSNLLIDSSLVHHCLWSSEANCNAGGCRNDAHGIVAGAIQGLTIRNTEIHTISGDAFQVDPGRGVPGWNDVVIEGCLLWSGPLATAEGGFAAGVNPAENAVDTKTPNDQPAARLTIRNTTAWGFRGGLISNMAAFNLKENVVADIDGVTVFASEIAFRLRGATGSRPDGVKATLRNTVIYNCDKAIRYEDGIVPVALDNVTLGNDIGAYFNRAGAPADTIRGRNVLVVAATLPSELAGGSNVAVGDNAIVDALAHDYHLVAGSPAVDQGEMLSSVTTDRDGVARPQGSGWDVGAYEFCSSDCGRSDAGAVGNADAGTGSGGADAGADAGNSSGNCGCRSSSPGTPAAFTAFLLLLAVTRRRRQR